MIRTDNEHGLTVRQGLGDGSIGTAKLATVSRTLRKLSFRSKCPPRKAG